MLVPKKLSKSKQMMLAVAVILILLVIGYLIYTTFIDVEIEEVDLPTETFRFRVLDIPKSGSNIELNDDFLTKPPYSELTLPKGTKLPVTVDSMGRKNPFESIPY